MSMEAAGCSLQLLEVAVYLYNPISCCRHVVEVLPWSDRSLLHMHVTFDLSHVFFARGWLREAKFGYSLTSRCCSIVPNALIPVHSSPASVDA